MNLDKLIILLILSCSTIFIVAIVALVVALVARSRRATAPANYAVGVYSSPGAQQPDPTQVVEVGHVVTSGLTLRYGNGRFVLDGVGQLSPADVRQRDAGGDLAWASAETRDWFLRSFPA